MCSLGKGIKLNKKRRKNQKRFYNVTSKRPRIEREDVVDTSQLNTAHDDIETTCSKVDNYLTALYNTKRKCKSRQKLHRH